MPYIRIVLATFFSLVAKPAGAEIPIDQMIVTDERRQTPAQNTAASISVIAHDEIRLINADHPSEILNRQAGVYIHRGNGQEHLTSIRSPVLTGGAGAGSFLFLENGVPLRATGFANVNELFEANTELAQRIEVVKGPSGSLYGANAIHGVINVVTLSPAADGAGFVEISADTIGRMKAKGSISSIMGNQKLLGGLYILNDPGFRDDSGVDSQKFLLRHDYIDDDVSIQTTVGFTNLNQETAGFVEGPQAFRKTELRQSNANPNAFRDAKSFRLSSRVEAPRDGYTIVLTPYFRWNDMSFLMHFVPSQALESNSHWSVGAQNGYYFDLGEKWKFIGGFDIDYTEGALTEFQSLPDVFSYTTGSHYDYRVKSLEVSPFFKVTGEIMTDLEFSAAARADYTHYDYENRGDVGIVGRFLRIDNRTDNFTTLSPKFSLIYSLERGSIFMAYARGARPPQTSDLYRLQINQISDRARSESIDSVELGYKGKLADWLSLEAAAYFMGKDNFFFRDADGYNVNNGKTRHVGGELTVNLNAPRGFVIDGNVSYGRHTYRFSRPVQSVPQATESIVFGATVDTAPRWLAGARLKWAPDSHVFSSELEWLFVDKYFMDAANSVSYPGHNLFNLRAGWRASDRVTIAVNVRNLFNRYYAERADFAFGSERYFPGEGRVATFGLRIGS